MDASQAALAHGENDERSHISGYTKGLKQALVHHERRCERGYGRTSGYTPLVSQCSPAPRKTLIIFILYFQMPAATIIPYSPESLYVMS